MNIPHLPICSLAAEYRLTPETVRKYIEAAGIQIVEVFGKPGIYVADFPKLISQREQKTEGTGERAQTSRRSMATLQNGQAGPKRKGTRRQDLRASSAYEIESPKRRKGPKAKPTG